MSTRTENEKQQAVRYWPTTKACQALDGCLPNPAHPGRCLYCDHPLPTARERLVALITRLRVEQRDRWLGQRPTTPPATAGGTPQHRNHATLEART